LRSTIKLILFAKKCIIRQHKTNNRSISLLAVLSLFLTVYILFTVFVVNCVTTVFPSEPGLCGKHLTKLLIFINTIIIKKYLISLICWKRCSWCPPINNKFKYKSCFVNINRWEQCLWQIQNANFYWRADQTVAPTGN
jgi:hypothetical protein